MFANAKGNRSRQPYSLQAFMYSIPLVSSLSLMRGARAIALPLAIATLVASCGEGQKQARPPPPAVTVAEPVKRTVFDYDEYVGRFTAINSVEVAVTAGHDVLLLGVRKGPCQPGAWNPRRRQDVL